MTTASPCPDLPEPDRNTVTAAGSAAGPSALIVHQNAALRLVLRNVLTERLGVENVIEVECLDTAIEQLATGHEISLVIIGLELHGIVPCMTVRLLRRHFPGIRLAVLSPCIDKIGALLHLAAGVHGQIDVAASVEELAEALDLVRRGRVAVPSWLPDLGWDLSSFDDDEDDWDQTPGGGPAGLHALAVREQQTESGDELNQPVDEAFCRHQ